MINKAVYYLLSNNTALTALVGADVFPVVMPEKTEAPCVVFFRDSLNVIYDKASPVVDESEVSVICFSKDYPEAVDIIQAVRDAIEGQRGEISGEYLHIARVQRGEEGYDVGSDTYFQKMTFIFKSTKIES